MSTSIGTARRDETPASSGTAQRFRPPRARSFRPRVLWEGLRDADPD